MDDLNALAQQVVSQDGQLAMMVASGLTVATVVFVPFAWSERGLDRVDAITRAWIASSICLFGVGAFHCLALMSVGRDPVPLDSAAFRTLMGLTFLVSAGLVAYRLVSWSTYRTFR
jgi:hypothetical protein